ncbi:MAG: hypothetical protein H7239_15870 [Flavobacterium sp.]|nr:hypothetical protein [Flavobacterium sp.]
MISCTSNEEVKPTNKDLSQSFSVNISSVKSRSKIYPAEYGAWNDITDSSHPRTIEWNSATKTITFIYDSSYTKVYENCFFNGNSINFESSIPYGTNGEKMAVFHNINFDNPNIVTWGSMRGSEWTDRELTIKK